MLDVGISTHAIEITMFVQGMGIALTLFPGVIALTQAIPHAREPRGAGMLAFIVRLIPPANVAIVSTFLSLRQHLNYGQLAMQVSPGYVGAEAVGTSPEVLTSLVQRTAYMLAIQESWGFLLLTAVVGLLLCMTLRQEPVGPT